MSAATAPPSRASQDRASQTRARQDSAVGLRRWKSFLLTRVQPALSGLMDGSLSTLAPIFAVVWPPTAR